MNEFTHKATIIIESKETDLVFICSYCGERLPKDTPVTLLQHGDLSVEIRHKECEDF